MTMGCLVRCYFGEIRWQNNIKNPLYKGEKGGQCKIQIKVDI